MNDKDNSFGSKPTLLMIDLNDIINILKGDDTIDNNINISHLRNKKWPC
jgi:hypothetical protein